MIRKRRIVASMVVVAVGAIAACLGPKLSSTEQEAVVCQSCSNGTVTIMPSTPVNTTGFADITISPASGSASSYDRIDMINYNCPSIWSVDATLPGEVIRTCGGSGSMIPSAKEPPSGAGTGDTCFDQTYTFRVNFTPTTAGSASCSLMLVGPGLSLPITVFGTGVAMPFAMNVTPTDLPFGDVIVNTSSSQMIDIQNTGTNALTINSISITPQTGYLPVTLPTPNPIPAGQTAKATVTCNPMTVADFNSTLTVNAANVSPQTVTLSCSGIMSNIVVNPTPIDVTTRVGEPVTRSVTIENTGGATATLDSVTVNKTVANVPITLVNAPPPGTQLGSGGGSVTFGVKYDPTAAQTFAELAKLHIVHDTTSTRDVKINGAALDTAISVFPDVVDFGAVCAGAPVMKDVTIKAGAAGDFLLQSVSSPQSPFAFAPKSPPLNFPVTFRGNGQNSVDFVATIAATTPADSVESMSMLSTDIPNDKMHALRLKAQVLPGGVGATPANLDFGGVLENTLSSAMVAEVRNCSEAPLAITDVHVEGINAADFSIVLPTEKLVTLQPHESVQYHVVMRGDKPGAKVASLVVASASSTSRVSLLGTVLGGSGGTGDDSLSYYGCAIGGGSSGLVIVFAIALAARRRRRK